MTTYGTFPTSSLSADLDFIKQRIRAGLRNHRPWKIMFNFRSFGIPSSIHEAMSRNQNNLMYFEVNYSILLLLALFIFSLLNPITVIIFGPCMACMLYLLFFRDEQLVILGHTINNNVVLVVMLVFNFFLSLLVLNGFSSRLGLYAKAIIVLFITIVVTVRFHPFLRKTDDLSLNEEAARLTPPPATAAAS